jgi:peptidyl-prolyl cis-trans isomerase C
MSKIFRLYLAVLFLMFLTISFQGCDQIQKFKNYLSPQQTPQEALPAQQQPEKVSPPVAEPAAPVAKAPVSAEPQSEIAPNVLAKVGGWSITIEEFNEQLSALQETGIEDFDISNLEQKQYILGQVLQQQVLVQAALKEKMDQDKDVIEAVKAFRDTLLAQAFVEKMTEGLTVSDEETRKFYDENKNEFQGVPQWHVKEIVVDTEEKARGILVELNQGAGFEDIARERSIGKTAAQGGDLGFMNAFEEERMGQIVSAMDIGAVSGMFRGAQGVYIVKLVDKKDGEIAAFEDVQEDLKNYLLMMKQQQAVFEVLAQVQEEIEIHINEQLLEE